eukprot:3606146-Rhodomonas_salina.3
MLHSESAGRLRRGYLGCESLAVWGDELQSEVADEPEEGGEVLGKVSTVILAALCGTAHVDVLGEVHDEREVVESALIDGADAVVHEVRGQEQSKREDGGIMLAVCIQRSDPLRVDDDEFVRIPVLILSFQHLVPQPQSFCARIHCGSNLESSRLFKQDPVHQKALSCAIQSHHSDDGDRVVDLKPTTQNFSADEQEGREKGLTVRKKAAASSVTSNLPSLRATKGIASPPDMAPVFFVAELRQLQLSCSQSKHADNQNDATAPHLTHALATATNKPRLSGFSPAHKSRTSSEGSTPVTAPESPAWKWASDTRRRGERKVSAEDPRGSYEGSVGNEGKERRKPMSNFSACLGASLQLPVQILPGSYKAF